MQLVARNKNYLFSDEKIEQVGDNGLYSETTYPDEHAQVEKVEIDLFGDPFRNEKIKADLYFVGGLSNFNRPMIKYSWEDVGEVDLLKLPRPVNFGCQI